ncbi:MAG: hypothetical protein WCC01_08815 [Acidimicrobiia bacterium]
MRRIWESGISRRRVLDVATILLFGFAALVFIGFAPIRGSTVGAVDVVTQQTSPYLESREVFQRSRNPIQTDQTDGIALAATFWRDMQRGEIRMWEPNLGTGAPLGGVVYTRVWSPFYWIGVLVPPNVLTSWAAWLAIWTAQVGAWCLARRLGVGHIGAMLAGIAYGFSGSVTALLFRVNETALAPWVLLAVHLVVSKRSPVRLRAVLGLAVAVALTWLGGFPAGTIMILYAAAAVAIGTVLVESGWQIRVALNRLAIALAGVVAGTLLVAPLLLPSYEFLSASESLARSYGSDHSAGLAMFGTSVSGRILGSFPDGTWWWPVPGYSNPVEASATVGVVALLLLLIGGLARRFRPNPHATRIIGRVYLPLGLVVFAGTFLGGPVLASLHVLPFLASNSFGRARFLLALAVALAAGNVLDGLLRSDAKEGEVEAEVEVDKVFRILSLAVVGAALVGAAMIVDRAVDVGMLDRAFDGLRLPLVVAAISVSLLLMARIWQPKSPGRAIVACSLIALLAVELQWGAWGFTPVVPSSEGFYPDHESIETMEPDLADGLSRMAGTRINVIRPNSAAWLEIPDLRISNPSYDRYRELMRQMDPEVFSRARLRTWFTEDLDPSSPILDRSAVRYLVAPAQQSVLEAYEAESVAIQSQGSVILGNTGTPARALSLDFGTARCRGGSLVATSAGDIVGHRPLWQLRDQPFELPLEDLEGDETVSLSITGCDLELPLTATVVRAEATSSLHLVRADDVVIYERAGARPRVELATRVMGIPDPATRLAMLATSPETGTAVLDADTPLTLLSGGTVALLDDQADSMVIDVDSRGPGLVVIRDANAPGWHATVNGVDTEILHVDHAYRAIEVPDGRSTVQLTYYPDSRRVGFLFAGLALLVLGFVGLVRFFRRRRSDADRRRTKISDEGQAPVEDRAAR